MTKNEELELFDHLSRNAKFREWLKHKASAEVEILMNVVDVDQLRRAQGRAGLLESMTKLLDAAPGAVKR